MPGPVTTRHLAKVLRKHQEQHPQLGNIFTAMHTFIDRTVDRFFREDANIIPPVMLSFQMLTGERQGEFRPMDGYAFEYCIVIDPFKVTDAAAAVEIVAHELVHVWLHWLGYDQSENNHSDAFHEKMADYGIATAGHNGDHVGTMGDVWSDWMKENQDLGLGFMVLGPMERTDLHVYECKDCGFSFQTYRKRVSVTCTQTEGCWSEMERLV